MNMSFPFWPFSNTEQSSTTSAPSTNNQPNTETTSTTSIPPSNIQPNIENNEAKQPPDHPNTGIVTPAQPEPVPKKKIDEIDWRDVMFTDHDTHSDLVKVISHFEENWIEIPDIIEKIEGHSRSIETFKIYLQGNRRLKTHVLKTGYKTDLEKIGIKFK